MEMTKQGQRLLMAVASENHGSEGLFAADGILVTIGGLLSLVTIAVLCICSNRKAKPDDQDKENGRSELNHIDISMDERSPELAIVSPGEDNVMNEGQALVDKPPGLTDHKRQSSTCSGPPTGLRPTSMRELPEPPKSAHHSRNTSMSGVELPPLPDSLPSGGNREIPEASVTKNLYAYPKLGAKGNMNGGGRDVDKVKSHSDGYDHLGQRLQGNPIDYDSLMPDGQDNGERSLLSETERGAGHHYSLVRDRTYDVVNDVRPKKGLMFDPYSTVSDKNDKKGEISRTPMDEDPYNLIGESDGELSNSFISRMRESNDSADPYATVEDDSGGDQKCLSPTTGIATSSSSNSSLHVLSNLHKEKLSDYGYTREEEEEEEEPEYAVVQKRRDNPNYRSQTDVESVLGARASHASSDDYSSTGAMPPEPPRLYNAYEDEDDDVSYSVTSPGDEKTEHKYSRVTARESLASMTARNALNPYELVQDVLENMYATVDGGSGDGIVLRHVDSDDNNSNRNSQNSDTYAEIAISGGFNSMTVNNNSSVMGSASSTPNALPDTSVTSSGAPAPPSLNSLHLMTKSQTSSEDDRLSDRHLATPEDSGLDSTGFPHLPAWGSRTLLQADEDSGGSTAEDGYSTLKRFCGGASSGGKELSVQNSNKHSDQLAQRTITGQESAVKTQLSQGYSRVKDCVSQEDLPSETENDPNYESVDEARAKLRLLYRTEKRVGEENDKGEDSLDSSIRNNVTVIEVLQSAKTATVSNSCVMTKASSNIHHTPPHNSLKAPSTSSEKRPHNIKTKRRPNHDYEELDLSPPTSPSAPSMSYSSSPLTLSPASPSSEGVGLSKGNLARAKKQLIQSHMYEDISEVRLQYSKISGSTENSAVFSTPVQSVPSERPLLPDPVSASPSSTTVPQRSSGSTSASSCTANRDDGVDAEGFSDLKSLVNTANGERIINDTNVNTGEPAVIKEAAKSKTGPAVLKKGLWNKGGSKPLDSQEKTSNDRKDDETKSKQSDKGETSQYTGTRV